MYSIRLWGRRRSDGNIGQQTIAQGNVFTLEEKNKRKAKRNLSRTWGMGDEEKGNKKFMI
jgi:hypothetical protein